MANQSKSMVFGFVIIAAIIFAVALGYRMTQDDESTQPATEKSQSKIIEKEPEIKVVSYDEDPSDMVVERTPEVQAKIEERSPYFMKFSMYYKTGDKAVQKLYALVESGNIKEAEHLVDFIESKFPDTKIPDEFADL